MTTLPARTRSFSHGDTLLQAGSDHEEGFVILSGHVKLRPELGAMVERAGQGAVIGAVSLLFGGAQEYTAVARGDVEAAIVDRATMAPSSRAIPSSCARRPAESFHASTWCRGRSATPFRPPMTAPLPHQAPDPISA